MSVDSDLIEKLGGQIVGITVLIELSFLPGREKVKPYENVHAVLSY